MDAVAPNSDRVDDVCPPQGESRPQFRASGAGTVAKTRLSRGRETHARSFAKAVSWRATGSLDTFVVAFDNILGSPKVARSVAVTR